MTWHGYRRRVLSGGIVFLLAVLIALVFSSQARAADLVVNSSANSANPNDDVLTLREAINQANSNDEPDTITFDLSEDDRTIALTKGQLEVTRGTLVVNGGGIVTVSGNNRSRVFEVTNQGTRLNLKGITLTRGNSNEEGGALFVNPGSTTVLTNSTISNSKSVQLSGGGIFNGGTLTIVSSTISNNTAEALRAVGGGIHNTGTMKIESSTISNNSLKGTNQGGGIFNEGTLTVDSSSILDNSANFGGGIFNKGTLTVKTSTVAGNSAGCVGGGGIANVFGTLTVDSSTISGNSAGRSCSVRGDGASIYSETEGFEVNTPPPAQRTTITNSTISGNESRRGASAVFNDQGYTEISYSTVVENRTTNVDQSGGSALLSADSSGTGIRLTGTIVTNNTRNLGFTTCGPLRSEFASGGGNVIGKDNGCHRSGAFTKPGDLTGVGGTEVFGTDMLVLQNNGGPTRTIALPQGSVAIDRAPSGPTVDQRGGLRPFKDPSVKNSEGSDGTDSGAYERNAGQPGPNYVVTRNDDRDESCSFGNCSLREAWKAANATSTEDVITFDLSRNNRTVTLTRGQLLADRGEVTVDGGEIVTINGDDKSRIFRTRNGGTALTIKGLTLTGGNADRYEGGAVYVGRDSSVLVQDSTITGNSAGGSGGGGLFNEGTLRVETSTISNNSTARSGGGIYSQTDAYREGTIPPAPRTTIINSTLADNSAGRGSGIYNVNGYTEVGYSTIANNTATDQSDGFGVTSVSDFKTTMRLTGVLAVNNIISSNTPGTPGCRADVGNAFSLSRPFESGGGNVIGQVQSGRAADFDRPGDRKDVSVEDAFGTATPALVDNGGPTRTIALQRGSTAIDNAPPGPDVDQRGEPRPNDDPRVENAEGSDGTDSGAFEKVPVQDGPDFVVTRSDERDERCLVNDCSLREAWKAANATSAKDVITFDLSEGSRTINLTEGQLKMTKGEITVDGDGIVTLRGTPETRIFEASASGSVPVLAIRGLTMSGGTAEKQPGGALYMRNARVKIEDSIISNNSANEGGGIFMDSGSLTVEDSTISNNVSRYSGGAIEKLYGNLTVTNSTISGNSADRGGGIYGFAGQVTVEDSAVTGNSAKVAGGGIGFRRTFNFPGGIPNLTVRNSTISGNSASEGGGVFSDMDGKTRFQHPDAKTTITNSTIAGNRSIGGGSGVYNSSGRTEISYSTIANNSASGRSEDGFGVTSAGDGYTGTALNGTLVASNTTGSAEQPADIGTFGTERSFESGGGNVIGQPQRTTVTSFREPGDVTSVSVLEAFGTSTPELKDNGGPTETVAIEYESLPYNRIPAGAESALAKDQRGVERPQFNRYDSGAFELDRRPDVIVSPDTLPDAIGGEAYSEQLRASGASGPYTFTVIEGELPDGLVLSEDGLISGTPSSQSRSETFTVQAQNGSGFKGEREYALSVTIPEIVVSPRTLSEATGGEEYSAQLRASGTSGPYTFSVTEGELPDGLTLSEDGLISGTPSSKSRSESFKVRAEDSRGFEGEREYTISVTMPEITVSPKTFPEADGGKEYSLQLRASGATGPYTFNVTKGELPDGLTLSENGLISGAPTSKSRTEEFTIRAEDSKGFDGEREYTLSVTIPEIAIAPEKLPDGAEGRVYSEQLRASGTAGPYTFGVMQGQLPDGLTLSQDGLISGTPSDESATETFTVQAESSKGFKGEREYILTIIKTGKAPTISEISDRTIRENTSTEELRFAIKNAKYPAGDLTLKGNSSNTDIVRQGGIKFFGSGENRSVQVTPVKNKTGSTLITVSVRNKDGLTASETFRVTVRSAPTPPKPDDRCTITGTPRDDLLRGTSGRDVICGLAGDDLIYGLGGDDILRGDLGVDRLIGGPGADKLYGNEGNDFLDTRDGVKGNDSADGGPGRNTCETDPRDLKKNCSS